LVAGEVEVACGVEVVETLVPAPSVAGGEGLVAERLAHASISVPSTLKCSRLKQEGQAKDKGMPDEEGTQLEPTVLTGPQRALYDALSVLSPNLAAMYHGALQVLGRAGNPERHTQSAHSLRELPIGSIVARLRQLREAEERPCRRERTAAVGKSSSPVRRNRAVSAQADGSSEVHFAPLHSSPRMRRSVPQKLLRLDEESLGLKPERLGFERKALCLLDKALGLREKALRLQEEPFDKEPTALCHQEKVL
jgi:hypothetical protein